MLWCFLVHISCSIHIEQQRLYACLRELQVLHLSCLRLVRL